MKRLRILLADDHLLIREGIKRVLESERDWEICAEAADGHQAVESAKQERPDVVIMDITMPQLNGLEATRQIRHALPETEVLILTVHQSEELLRKSLEAGARGVMLKADAGKILVEAVATISQHQPFLTPHTSARLFDQRPRDKTGVFETRPREPKLTPRENEIIQFIAEGKTTKQIAGDLGISFRTAETHRANLMRKLRVHSVSDLTRYAIRNKFVEP